MEDLKKEYKLLCELFGIKNRLWSMLHEQYSPAAFCPANRASFIGEYLVLKNFVERAKEVGFVYYYGIDDFLSEYKDAVEPRVNLD